ncbi:hypothetical protein [Natrinema longum]|uniref:Uncharacterized protein n=1 Tax=Natrinema longum TaxID=370324 RepID=A0A8A2UAX2_9EURY|nr:hypothetical protein [Natrinema longum]MBZ6496330.1 hypothetical protein [Natrinema longum]QSW85757.1 hypothetical protein J0X27_02655 [Natrinema longum]
MNRRPFLQALATGGALLSAGCTESLPLTGTRLETDDVFEEYWYEETDLLVQFRDDVDVEQAILVDSSTDEEFDRVEGPVGTARFPVLFPNRLETALSSYPGLRVRAETPDGTAHLSVWDVIHGVTRAVEPLPDGRARFTLENQGDAPLLARFVAIYGDVPNPTVDPQADSFDSSTFDPGPGVIGIEENRPLSPSRTDLVVPPGETKPFETTYAPFVFPDGVDAADCGDAERRGKIAVLHGSGGSATYGFTYTLDGEPAARDGQTAAVCETVETGSESN